ncbi:hypothetical protein WA026_006502 [Henosepilachna vigintioctopunctata]|uniref:Small ribosomal subunit protein uS5 n=1 Tax=Henosepilachna vigintioctopunctata TaxID=420089 RepID=A0AAW1UE64_9CUCU
MPVQKQTRAGQRTRFKAFVAIGDSISHTGLEVKSSKEVATGIRGAIILAKLPVVPVRRVTVRLIPAPRGTGIVSALIPKKLLQMAGIEDSYTSARGSTGTLSNFAKATYAVIAKTYAYLTPDLWDPRPLEKAPYQEFADYFAKNHKLIAGAHAADN